MIHGERITGVRFFFSSRRRHTRFDCDWSSDVCSSDLGREVAERRQPSNFEVLGQVISWSPEGDILACVRSEEHTSELQSQSNLVCRLLLEKKKIKQNNKTGLTKICHLHKNNRHMHRDY